MVKIVALSDTHTKHRQVPLPEGDILIHAGDMTGRGNYHEFIGIGQWFRDCKDRFKHQIIIAGNHDFGLEVNSKVIMRDHFDENVIYLQDSGIELEGIKFYGCPWMPVFYNWAFMRDESELAPYYNAIPDDTEVLITHGPPLGILDQNGHKDKCGSITLYNRIKELKHLKHHIFGHIHEAYGKLKIDDVTFHNVCSLNGDYRFQNMPQVIEIIK